MTSPPLTACIRSIRGPTTGFLATAPGSTNGGSVPPDRRIYPAFHSFNLSRHSIAKPDPHRRSWSIPAPDRAGSVPLPPPPPAAFRQHCPASSIALGVPHSDGFPAFIHSTCPGIADRRRRILPLPIQKSKTCPGEAMRRRINIRQSNSHQPIQRTHHTQAVLPDRHVQVNLRRADILVPQQILDLLATA